MKRILIYLSILAIIPISVQSQDTLTLDDCYRHAIAQYPLSAQFALLDQKNELQIQKLNTNYLPHLNINGQASYQSDVTKVAVVFEPVYLPPPINQEVECHMRPRKVNPCVMCPIMFTPQADILDNDKQAVLGM